MNKKLTVIILAHKSKNLVLDFIKNIYNEFKIIVIDNSNDLKLKKIIKTKYLKINIHFIANNGYANAVNYGSKLVKTKYFLISNPDVVGLNKFKLNRFLYYAKQLKDKFSALGPRYINYDPKSLEQSINNNSIAKMPFLSGACMFFNRKIFLKSNGFDENFFLYFEENDFCKRTFKINMNYQVNDIKVIHNAGNSVEIKNENEKTAHSYFRTWHFMWSKFYFYKKHYGFLFALFYFIPIILRTILKIFFFKIINSKKNMNKYKQRLSGLYASIIGKKSYKRL
jgi:GT2 family glycosyltransferase